MSWDFSKYDYSNDIQLSSDNCNNTYQMWNITRQQDRTYRFSSPSNNNRVLTAYNTTTTAIGHVQINNWTNGFNQEWTFYLQNNNTYRIVPRATWWRVMIVYGTHPIILPLLILMKLIFKVGF